MQTKLTTLRRYERQNTFVSRHRMQGYPPLNSMLEFFFIYVKYIAFLYQIIFIYIKGN